MKRGGRSAVLLAGAVAGHLLLISGRVDDGTGRSLLERGVLAVFGPLQRAVTGTLDGARAAWTGYVDLRGVRAENERLAQRVAALQTELHLRRREALEAARLRRLTGLRETVPAASVVARAIGRDGTPWFRTLTLDRGSEAGIVLDAAVADASGVLGRVIGVGPWSSRVQLLLHRESGAGARIERSRVTGVVSGQVGPSEGRSRDLVLKYVPQAADVVVGDAVVTSGLDGIFPPGLPLGTVSSVEASTGLFLELRVAPAAGFDEVEEVLVILPGEPVAEITESVG